MIPFSQLADRVALLHGGRLIADAAPDEAMTAGHLRIVYGLDVELHAVALADGTRYRTCIARAPGPPC